MGSSLPAGSMPVIDEAVRGRLMARFGDGVGSWLDELPEAFDSLAQRWHLEYGPLVGADVGRLLDWCVAFAAMVALELAERDAPGDRIETLLSLARSAPR